MRPAREGEVPRFGSVWRWRDDVSSTRFVVLGLRHRPAPTVMLLAVSISTGSLTGTPPRFTDGMTWGFRNSRGDLVVTSGWQCVAEAPDL